MDAYISKPITKTGLRRVMAHTLDQTVATPEPSTSISTRTVLLDQIDGDAELLDELKTAFRQSAPDALRNMRESIAARDARLLERSAHSLLSSFGVFGAEKATELTKKLENAGRAADFSEAPHQLDELERETNRIFASLADY